MGMVLNFQNFTFLVWTTIIALSFYAILCLYRFAEQYRLERDAKLEATKHLRQQIEWKRKQYAKKILKTAVPQTVTDSNNIKSYFTLNNRKTLPLTREKHLQQPPQPVPETISTDASRKSFTNTNDGTVNDYRKFSGIFSSRNTCAHSPITCIDKGDPNVQHTLYISDSKGHVVQEISFRECDYMDAFNTAISNQVKEDQNYKRL